MDYLQYDVKDLNMVMELLRFKPYYKWITFNTRKGSKYNYRIKF